jgi:hypothetical protein
VLQEAAGLRRQHKRTLHVRRVLYTARTAALMPARHFTPRKTHLAFITKLNMCLLLRCDCLRDGDTDGVTADNMSTLRKPLEKCLLGSCPVFPFDLADQPVPAAASAVKGAHAAAASAGMDSEGGTLVPLHHHTPPLIHAHTRAPLLSPLPSPRCAPLHRLSPYSCRSCPPSPSLKARAFWTSK